MFRYAVMCRYHSADYGTSPENRKVLGIVEAETDQEAKSKAETTLQTLKDYDALMKQQHTVESPSVFNFCFYIEPVARVRNALDILDENKEFFGKNSQWAKVLDGEWKNMAA